jgi:hypothetical protein
MVKPIDSKRLTTELPGTQHRAEEAGQIIEGNDAPPGPTFVLRPAPIRVRRRTTSSLRWNERFVIQPLRPGIGMLLRSENRKRTSTNK